MGTNGAQHKGGIVFKAKDIISEAVERALELFRGYARGHVVPWLLIEETTGLSRESSHWTAFNKRFRRDFLNETGVLVWPVAGEGLKLVTEQEQLGRCQDARRRRSLRQLTRAVTELRALPDDSLSEHERSVKQAKLDQSRTARRAVLYATRAGDILTRRKREYA